MTRTIGKTLRTGAAIALAFALTLSGFASVWAAPPEDIPETTAAVTKILKVPKGTTIPTATFSFEAVLQGSGGPATLDIPDITIDGTEPTVTANNVTTVKKQTADFIKDIDIDDFTATGKYVYRITETAAAYTAITDTTVYTYESKAVYEVHIYVEPDPVDTSKRIIKYVTAWRTVDDMGSDITDVKVDPSPGDGTNTFSHMDFTNNYVKTESPIDPTDPNPDPEDYDLFHVSKTVADYGTTPDDTYFPFSVTVVNPAFPVPDGQTGGLLEYYRAYVLDASGPVTIVSDIAAKSGTDTYGDYITFKVGEPKIINLNHGLKLVFPTLPVGATWTTSELLGSSTDYEDYTAKADVTSADVLTVPYFTAPKGQSLTVSAPVGEDSDPAVSTNAADFTNDKGFILPMGIDVNNLPYIGLILLALAGLAAYVAIRTRGRKARTSDI
jgi:hypothetical protein